MSNSRTLPLYDPTVQPSTWNERMAPGEYAVLFSNFEVGESPFCTVFATLPEAKAFASERIRQKTVLRCRIYDHQGLARNPVQEMRGQDHQGEGDLSPGFRRWVGSILLLGAIVVITINVRTNYKLPWPALVGTSMLILGGSLLFAEFAAIYKERHRAGSI